MTREGARDNVLASIDGALTTFGDSVRIVVYYELDKLFGVSREDVVLKPEKLDETINKIFGVGAQVIRKAIFARLEKDSGMKNLASQGLASAIRAVYHEKIEKMSWLG